jgi:hypothetical protein
VGADGGAPAHAIGPTGAPYRLARACIPWLGYGDLTKLAGRLKRNAPQCDAVVVNGLWNYASFGA